MNLFFTHKNNNPRLLLIYAGWSTDESAFASLRCNGYDIAVASDYTDLTPLNISGYDEVVLLAWSLGVHAAELTATNLPLTLTIAVCGTPTPADDLMGIPVAIWKATAEGLTEASLTKFRRRMGATYLPRGSRSIEELKRELIEFPTTAVDFRWDRAIIATGDRIFPPENQLHAWQGRAEITEIDASHTPDFQQIVDRFVINKALVGNRFKRGCATYNLEATPQQRIADHLFELWRKHGLHTDSILEIGVGTGYFTSLYAKKIPSATEVFWDIAPVSETVIKADAEAELPKITEHFGTIVSASTMQWFNSQAAFLIQIARVLKTGGLGVFSTFGPETFRELTEAGVCGLSYLSEDSLRHIIPESLEVLELHSGIIIKTFNEPIDALRHLQATGVNARHSSKSVRQIIADYPRNANGHCDLTYQPIYIIVRKNE